MPKKRSSGSIRTSKQKKTDRYLRVQIGSLTGHSRPSRRSAATKYGDDGEEMEGSDSEEWANSNDAVMAMAEALHYSSSSEEEGDITPEKSDQSDSEMPEIVGPGPMKSRKRKQRKFERGGERDDHRYYISCPACEDMKRQRRREGEVKQIVADATLIKRHFKGVKHSNMTATERKTYIALAPERLKEAQSKAHQKRREARGEEGTKGNGNTRKRKERRDTRE